jgi:GGDEF domain-containing protein
VTSLPTLSTNTFADFVDSMPIPVVVCGADGRILHVSPALNETFGLPRTMERWQGLSLADLPLKPAASVPEFASKLYLLDDDTLPAQRFRLSSATLGGDAHGVITVHYLMPLVAGPVDVLHPLAALGSRSSNIDRESGLQDRIAISQVLHSEVGRCRRYNNPLSVIMIWLNDASGRGLSAPDSLSAPAILGQLLAEQTRWADAIGRWSKEQFLLVLPETGLRAAELLSEKIRAAATAPERGDMVFDLRFSTSEWQRGDDARTLLARAEASLQSMAQSA